MDDSPASVPLEAVERMIGREVLARLAAEERARRAEETFARHMQDCVPPDDRDG